MKIVGASKFAFAQKTTTSRRLLKFGLSLSEHEKLLSRAKTVKVRWFLLDLRVQSIIKTAAEKLSLMTYASHARVITGIIQANLIHLSIKMTTLHQSGAPFVGEQVFQNRGVCGQAFPSLPSPTPFLPPFCSCPIFHASRMRKTNTRCRISAASISYAGYVLTSGSVPLRKK